MRHIPFWWTCIDISFGVFGAIPILFALAGIRALAAARTAAAERPDEDASKGEPIFVGP